MIKQRLAPSEAEVAGKHRGRVSVFGLGKVGLALAACLLDAGYRVLGFDTDVELTDDIAHGTHPIHEPGVKERLNGPRNHAFSVTADHQRAICDTDLTFVIVPTRSNAEGGFSLRDVKQACESIAAALDHKNGYHGIVIVSTMLPGSSESILIPLLEKRTGRQLGETLGYCYNPAFIALGDVVRGFVEPGCVIIGEADRKTGDRVLAIHRAMTGDGATFTRMSTTEAEIAKLAVNTHDTMRVSFANMLLGLCNEMPGTNVDRITALITQRMGKREFRGAVPYGGPCWPRDNLALAAVMECLDLPADLPRAIHQVNVNHAEYIIRQVKRASAPNSRVGVVGLAYKPGTGLIEAAFGMQLAQALAAEDRDVRVWDPLAMTEARALLGSKVHYAQALDECIRASDVVVIASPLAELAGVDWKVLGSRAVVDCWSVIRDEDVPHIRSYHRLGRGKGNGARATGDEGRRERFERLAE